MTFRTPEQVQHGAREARRYRTDQEREYADFYAGQRGYPETVPLAVEAGAEVVGRLGTDAEVGSFGVGVIEEITEDRSEAVVRWPNGQIRQMPASDIDFGLDRP